MCFWYLHCLPPQQHVLCELKDFLSNQEFQESIGGTVDAAVNLTGTVARVRLIILIVPEPSLKMLSTDDISVLFIIAVNDIVCTQVAIPVAQGVLESVPTLVSQGSRWGLEQTEFLAENLTLRQFEFGGRFHCYPLVYQFCISSNDSVPISFQYVLYELSHICIVQKFLHHLFR